MADEQPLTPPQQKITSIGAFSSEAQERILNLAQSPNTTRERLITEIYEAARTKGLQDTIDADAIFNSLPQAVAVNKPKEAPFEKKDNPFGPALQSTFGAVGAAVILNDQATQIQSYILSTQDQELQTELRQLLKDIHKVNDLSSPQDRMSPEERISMIRQKLASITSASLIEGQHALLQETLSETNTNQETRQAITEAKDGEIAKIQKKELEEKTKHDEKNASRKNPKLSEDERWLEDTSRRMLDLEKQLDEIHETDPAKREQLRERIIQQQMQELNQYTTYKQGRTTGTLRSILLTKDPNKKGLFRRKILDRKDKRQLLKNLKEKDKAKRIEAKKRELLARQKGEEEKRKQQSYNTSFLRKIFQRQIDQATYPQEEIEEEEFGQVNQAKEGGSGGFGNIFRFTRLLFGGGEGAAAEGAAGAAGAGAAEATAGGATAAGGGLAAILANPVTWIIIVIIVILFLIIFILVFIANNQGPTLDETITGVTCGDQPDGASANNSAALAKLINSKFHVQINTVISDPTADPRNVPIARDMYNTICLLFGDKANDPSNFQPQLNTFGNLTVGTQKERDYSQTMDIIYTIALDIPNKGCTLEKDPNNSNPNAAYWLIYNADQCLQSPGLLPYLLAQNLAQNLILQQQHTHKSTSPPDILNSFTQSPYTTTNLLPTPNCIASKKSEDCFTETVAAYLTWGYPFGGTLGDPSLAPSAQQSSANSTVLSLSTILSSVGQFPDTFPTYYSFAQNNLFDGLGFFSRHGNRTPPYTPSDYPAAMQREFGITLDYGNNTDYMKWTWEAFWYWPDSFLSGVKNSATVHVENGTSYSRCWHGDCNIYLHPGYEEQQFKAILTHEFSHIFDWTNPNSKTHRLEIVDAIKADNDYLTVYSREGFNCNGTGLSLYVQQMEDYAETLTYYIFPDIPESTQCSNGGHNDRFPYKNGAHPNHYQLAKEILGQF